DSWDALINKDRPDVGPLRQSAQQLCAARTAIEGLVTQLAACEIFARSSIGWKRNVGSAEKIREILNEARTKVAGPCEERCKKKFENRDECSAPTEKEI